MTENNSSSPSGDSGQTGGTASDHAPSYIELPALAKDKPVGKANLAKSCSASQSSAGHADLASAGRADLASARRADLEDTTPRQERPSLPEYQAPTNGLKELLSIIDPEQAPSSRSTPPFPLNPLETAMLLPDNKSGIPGSPDLPIGPTRWGLYFSALALTCVLLLASALTWTHISSPEGINWAKAQDRAGAAYEQVMAALTGREAAPAQPAMTSGDKHETIEPLAPAATGVATTSRMATTAATTREMDPASAGLPNNSDLFVSPDELEHQVRALEQGALEQGAPIQAIPEQGAPKPADELSRNEDPGLPVILIEPGVESRYYAQGLSLLEQRDISSARMIFKYAAELGSGISAMALAETYDPHQLQRTGLPGAQSDTGTARKWYKKAARLGIADAGKRLSRLK